MVPPTTWLTLQPWCVQSVVKALNSPFAGWVTTIRWSLRIFPPPTGMSLVRATSFPPAAGPCDGATDAGFARGSDDAAGGVWDELPLSAWDSVQPAASATAPVARTVRLVEP
jgi:hypothetical protein